MPYRTPANSVKIVRVPEMGELSKDDSLLGQGRLYALSIGPISALVAVMVAVSNGLLAGLCFAGGAALAIAFPVLLGFLFEKRRVVRRFEQQIQELKVENV